MLFAPHCGIVPLRCCRAVKLAAFASCIAFVGGWAQPLRAHPYYAPEACSDCHGDVSAMSTTPANGGSLQFFKTLVGRSSTASFTITNTSSAGPGIPPSYGGGGFSGSFPAASGPFSPQTSQTFNAAAPPGASTPYTFLLPPAVVSADGGQSSISRIYTFAPTARGTFNQPITFTPSAGFPLTVPSSTVTLSGQGVAPVISLNSSLAAAGNIRIGTSGTAKLSINNVGDGNQAGSGLGNLTGTVGAGSGGFSGGGGSFNLADAGSQTFGYTIGPTTHGAISSNIAVNATDGSTNGANGAPKLLDDAISNRSRPHVKHEPVGRQHPGLQFSAGSAGYIDDRQRDHRRQSRRADKPGCNLSDALRGRLLDVLAVGPHRRNDIDQVTVREPASFLYADWRRIRPRNGHTNSRH